MVQQISSYHLVYEVKMIAPCTRLARCNFYLIGSLNAAYMGHQSRVRRLCVPIP